MLGLSTKLRDVLGAKTATALNEALELDTVGDLLAHYPFRYAKRGEQTSLNALSIGDQVTVLAKVRAAVQKPMRNRRGKLLEVTVADDAGHTLTLTFFNQPWQARKLTPGRWGLFAGRVSEFRGRRQLNSPDCRLLATDEDPDDSEAIEEFAGALIPVYSASAKVPSWTIARCVRVVLDLLDAPGQHLSVPDPIPSSLRTELGLVDRLSALRHIHRPGSETALAAARKRLKWQEALLLQTVLVRRKAAAQRDAATPRPAGGAIAEAFDKRLPFELTKGQRDVGADIAADLARSHPMHRLLQGDVGSGKTLVALRAILQVVASGGQAALLAPTEVLASQHYLSIHQLLGDLASAGQLGAPEEATGVELITGSLPAAKRRAATQRVAEGSAGIVVGTHALLYDGVDFADLGLVVIDEQHRFGVEQRDALRAKASAAPHTLVMTATPIPRTVAMTVYGDLEVSRLTELPAGRSPIVTHVVPASDARWMDRCWERLIEEVKAGRQAYVVCPRVGDGQAEDSAEPSSAEPQTEPQRRPAASVLDTLDELAQGPLRDLRLGLLHGRLKPDVKDATMRAFAQGDIDVLVATTVIEVGVNVPNATMMVIMDADRFGISQLHQLRGRVGRGEHQGLCLLVSGAAGPPGGGASVQLANLADGLSPTRARLEAVASTVDGFKLAELDLEQRREGDVLGDAQSGSKSHVRLLSLLRDVEIIEQARAIAVRLVGDDVTLSDHPALAAEVEALAAERGEYLEKS
ncbi:ATP-dependent DNA helicase RecG [Natronoglycomyces albus]|uniref:Probable DNA 3'-5' helicase RecG n=1 Tax=Natronoglycomyces albus TaxID=2811108 RepID=A0A895XUK2_9ACTN|nr:ATP-dependent DNA helicase RecG [Natronoglycomyces albus]QSB06959.1 ATP-dependent DNA helicase RecG [Natronoglycomyces albus]